MSEHTKRQRDCCNETVKYQRFAVEVVVEVAVEVGVDINELRKRQREFWNESAKYQRFERKNKLAQKRRKNEKKDMEEVKNTCIIDTSRYTEVKLENGQFLKRNGSYFKILLGKKSSPPGKYFFFKIMKETKTSLTVEELRQDENNPERFYLTGLKNQYHGWVKCDGALSKASRRIQLFE